MISNVSRMDAARGGSHILDEFPQHVAYETRTFENWSGDISVPNISVCMPKCASDIVDVANWAHTHDRTICPVGRASSWAPLIVGEGAESSVVLVDMEKLHSVKIDKSSKQGQPAAATVETGILMEKFLDQLQTHNLTINAPPAIGGVTLGGAIAVGAHGTGVLPRHNGKERVRDQGEMYGTLGHRVLEAEAVVWDPGKERYVLQTFDRSDPRCALLATSLGSILVTKVKMAVCEKKNVLCESTFQSPADLFAPSKEGEAEKKSLASIVDRYGQVELLYFHHAKQERNVWVKAWERISQEPENAIAEWAKGWGYKNTGAWQDVQKIKTRPNIAEHLARVGQLLEEIDPNGVVSSPLANALFREARPHEKSPSTGRQIEIEQVKSPHDSHQDPRSDRARNVRDAFVGFRRMTR